MGCALVEELGAGRVGWANSLCERVWWRAGGVERGWGREGRQAGWAVGGWVMDEMRTGTMGPMDGDWSVRGAGGGG